MYMRICFALAVMAVAVVSSSIHAAVHVKTLTVLVNEVIEVPAATYMHYPLQLPQGTTVSVQIGVAGSNRSLDIAFVDDATFIKIENGQPYEVVEGLAQRVDRSGGITAQVATAGVYHLILDNTRARSASRSVAVLAVASGANNTNETSELESIYTERYNLLKGMFIFPDFDIQVTLCGQANAFSDPTITMCYELYEVLTKRGVSEAELFVFMHEVAHSLLKQWGLPLWDNEDAADELATVLLIALDQKDALHKAVEWWSQNTSTSEALNALINDDRHTLSPQRARNIANWLQDSDDRTLRWERLLIPHMTTEALKMGLKPSPEVSQYERTLIQEELTRRGMSASQH